LLIAQIRSRHRRTSISEAQGNDLAWRTSPHGRKVAKASFGWKARPPEPQAAQEGAHANEVGDEEADGVAVICEAVYKKFGGQVFDVKAFCGLLDAGPEPPGLGDTADKDAWRTAQDGATALREALQSIHDVPLPPGPLPNRRVGQILGKATNRPVRAGEKIVRLRAVHKGHDGRTYQLEVPGRSAHLSAPAPQLC
jgi:hypothetical protein